jgi:hypothetical protein
MHITGSKEAWANESCRVAECRMQCGSKHHAMLLCSSSQWNYKNVNYWTNKMHLHLVAITVSEGMSCRHSRFVRSIVLMEDLSKDRTNV